jgi:hypothetical protein
MFDRMRLRRPDAPSSAPVAPDLASRLQAARDIVAGARDRKKLHAAAALAGDPSALAAIDAIDADVATVRRLLDLADLAAEAARDDREAARDAQRRQAAIDAYNRALPAYRSEEQDRLARLSTQIDHCRRSREDNQALKFERLRDDPAYCRIPAPPPGWTEQKDTA